MRTLASVLLLSLSMDAQTITTFRVGTYGTGVNAINASGELVGQFYGGTNGEEVYGFYRDAQGVVHRMGATYDPLAINAGGEIAGRDNTQQSNGFYKPAGGSITQFLKYRTPFVAGVTDQGWIAGAYSPSPGDWQGFLMSPQGVVTNITPEMGMVVVAGVNQSQQVVGDMAANSNGAGAQGFLWDQGKLTDLNVTGADVTEPLGIGTSGEVVGTWQDGSGQWHGFWGTVGGGFASYDAPGAQETALHAVNASGMMLGSWIDAEKLSHTFLLSPQGTMTDITVPNAIQVWPGGINDSGEVAGSWIAKGKKARSEGFVLIP